MPIVAPRRAETRQDSSALAVLRAAQRAGELVHLEDIPGQQGQSTCWPETVRPEVAAALAGRGVVSPWTHQAQAAALALAGRHVIIATRAASGKSAGYLAAALSEVLGGGTALYIAPTKALAADQLKAIRDLGVPGVRATCYDGDSTTAERDWAQAHANYLLTNPDMIHSGLLPNHTRWRGFFRRLRVVIIDECHGYRGVFGSHVAHVLRRLRRVVAYYQDGPDRKDRDRIRPAPIGISPGGTTPRTPRGGQDGPDRKDRDRIRPAPIGISPGGTTPRTPRGGQDGPDRKDRDRIRPAPIGISPGGTTPRTPRGGAGQPPVFILASATIANPADCAGQLTGLDAVAVSEDGSPRAPLTFALWEPPLLHTYAEVRARRPATTEAADLLAAMVKAEVPALAFIRSRRGAETVALGARDALDDELSGNVAAYRSGYLPDDRRDLEAGLRGGRLTGMATTNALELGINITGLDAVLIAGWPGTWASLWQQAGRAGRAGEHATAVFIARDDPLDSYLVHHPDTLLHHPVEPAVLDPANPYVLGPHLVAAAAELPLTEPDLDLFGPGSATAVSGLTEAGELRRRPSGWYYARHGRPARDISIRGDLGRRVRVVEEATGRLVGTMDEPSAHRYVHDGAVYLHQGESYLVTRLDLADSVALVEPGDPGYTTQARDITDIDVIGQRTRVRWGDADLMLADVRVTRQVVEYARLRPGKAGRPGKKLKEPPVPLDLPERTLTTVAVGWTIPNELAVPVAGSDLGGAAHAAEHAAIGLLPLFATCDRWDVGGLSTELHPATGQLTVFVYDGHPGGAGFAERGFAVAAPWLRATKNAIASCPCESGCPSCVQSPKCGNGNSPLSKEGAVALLGLLLAHAR
jgi:DEAD/DEAH box helicase domain-containing protein